MLCMGVGGVLGRGRNQKKAIVIGRGKHVDGRSPRVISDQKPDKSEGESQGTCLLGRGKGWKV